MANYLRGLPGAAALRGNAGAAMDVTVGALIGVAGIAATKYVYNSFLKNKITNPMLATYSLRFLPVLSGVATATALLAFEKGNKGKSHALGALMAGVAVNVWDELRAQVPQLADLVSVRLDDGSYAGVYVDDNAGGYAGMIVDDSAANLAELQTISMSGEEEASY